MRHGLDGMGCDGRIRGNDVHVQVVLENFEMEMVG